jgi:hypothetical protein
MERLPSIITLPRKEIREDPTKGSYMGGSRTAHV